MSPDEIEIFILSNDIRTTIAYLMDENFLQKEAFCLQCFKPMNLVEYRRNIDKYAWRCMFKTCNQYKKYISIRTNSFFSAFKIELKQILRTIIRYACSTQRYSTTRRRSCPPHPATPPPWKPTAATRRTSCE